MLAEKKHKKLRNYQMDALRWSDGVRHPGFYLDMRLRKCLLTIRRVKRWYGHGPNFIVCPDSAIEGWRYWLESEGIHKIIELSGSAKQRHKDLAVNLAFSGVEEYWFITNKECHRSLPEIKDILWDVMVFDESRFLANPKSGMSKFYVENFRDVNHRIILSGTPDYRDKMDYYQQLRFLDHKSLPYKNFWDFRAQAFFQHGYDFIMKKKHNDMLTYALAKYCYVVKRADVPGGRTMENVKYTFKLPRPLRKKYNVAEEEFVFEKEHDMKTIFATQAHIWLMRMCGGFIDDTLVWDAKLKKIQDLLNHELENENVVILCRFKQEVYHISQYLCEHGYAASPYTGDIPKIKRRALIKDFNEKKFNILPAHPAAISHGTDLASATSIIYYSQPSGGELKDQSSQRIFTIADEKHMLIIELLAKGTVDEDTYIGHIEKESRRNIFNRAVKRCQQKNLTV